MVKQVLIVGLVYGIYSDGVTRDISRHGTTFSSSDPSLVSIDAEGKMIAHKAGNVSILMTNSGVIKVIPVDFIARKGYRPWETIPPVSSMEVIPAPNAAGWNNRNMTIILTARDNAGGSGINEIVYWLDSNGVKTFPAGGVAINISSEGIHSFSYKAIDKEGNEEKMHYVDLKLDKTPPLISLSLLPATCKPPKGRELEFPLAFFRKLSYDDCGKSLRDQRKPGGVGGPGHNWL